MMASMAGQPLHLSSLPRWMEPGRPFERDGLATRFAPFVGAALASAILIVVGPTIREPGVLVLGIVTATAAFSAPLVLPWQRVPPWLDAVPPIVGLVAIGLFRHAAGGAGSGYAPFALFPILWLALFGTRRQLAAGLVVTTAVLAAPLLVGAPGYIEGEWHRAGILIVVGAFTGLLIQRLVAEVRVRGGELKERGEQLAAQAGLNRAILDAADDAIVSMDESGRIVDWNRATEALLGDHAPLLGRDLFETLFPPAERDSLRSGFRRLLDEARLADDRRFETELLLASGATLPAEVTIAVSGEGGARRIHAFLRDISARRDAERSAREHLDDLARLLAVARELGRADPEFDGRMAICRAARDLAGSELALFFEARPDEQALVATGTSEDGPGLQISLDAQRSLTAAVFASGEPTFVGDLLLDARVDQAAARRLDVRAAYWQPVLRLGRPIGVLVVYWRTPREPASKRIESLLELFATQAAAVVERADLIGRLESLALTDGLTGVANRRALEDVLDRELAGAERSAEPLSIVLLDLDHFKRYNDRNGHQAGDRLLRESARAWSRIVRPTDTVARFGGEEFIVVLPETDIAAAVRIANRLRAAVPGGQTVSAGVATWNGDESIAELIARADAALYEAKAEGRNRTSRARLRLQPVPPRPAGGGEDPLSDAG